MKKIGLLLIALLLPLATVAADPVDEGFKGHHGQHLDRLSQELALTPEQKASLETIFKEEHEKFRALHEEVHARVRQVLNGEQIAKWEEMISRHKKRHGAAGKAE